MGTGERFQLSLFHSTEVSGKLFHYAAGFTQVFGEELNEAEKNICTYAALLSGSTCGCEAVIFILLVASQQAEGGGTGVGMVGDAHGALSNGS